uniref:C1q domain-containing protein n=1 Tax=Amphilophus citrinellus TaxID=61819 RepID=A0A3Q0RE80_AMPCI
MKIIVFSSLLLLVCSVSADQTETEMLRELTASLAVQKEQISVAFSASLLDRGEGDTGPFNTQTTLTFKRVVTNIGNAYNSHTGMFTAPVRGAYHFEWHIYGYGDVRAGAYLFRNGYYIFSAYENPTAGGGSGSNGALLHLEVGDQVYVRLWNGTRVFDGQNHINTFSGHLIFTM